MDDQASLENDMLRPLLASLLIAFAMIGVTACVWNPRQTKEPPLAGQPEGPFRPRPKPPIPPLPVPIPEPVDPAERVGWIEQIVDRRLERKLEEALANPELVRGGDPRLVGGWVSMLVSFIWTAVKAVVLGALADVLYSWWYVVVPVWIAAVSIVAWPAGWAAGKLRAKP